MADLLPGGGSGPDVSAPSRRRAEHVAPVVFVGAGLLLGGLAGVVNPLVVVAMVGGLTVFAASYASAAVACSIYLVVTPLIVGLERGAVLPAVRLNEALLLLVASGVLCSEVVRWQARGRAPISLRWFSPLDAWVGALAVFSSVSPLLWMYVRGLQLGIDDVLYAITLWKLAVVYVLFRIAALRAASLTWFPLFALVGAVPTALIGLAQAASFNPVISLLGPYSSPEFPADVARASSTVGAPIPFGDYMMFTLAVVAAWRIHVIREWRYRDAAMPVLALAALATGQVSVWLGLVIGALVLGFFARRFWHTVGGLALVSAVAAVILQPVLSARLAGPKTGGLPSAWVGDTGRLGNLVNHVLPQFESAWNWVLGVRTSARIPATEPWRDWIYIESGYVWLLWNGGAVLLVAFCIFASVALQQGRTAVTSSDQETRAIALAAITCVTMMLVLSVIDAHLTFRASSDLFFALLGVLVGRLTRQREGTNMSAAETLTNARTAR